MLFEKIEMFCSAYIEQEIQTPYVPMFIVKEMNRDPKMFLKRVLKGKKPPLEKIVSQINQEIKKGVIKPIEPVQLLLNTISLCVFPFLARPMIKTITRMNNSQFNQLMELRRREVPKMIINSIKA
jgi:hypothetical protein